MDRRSKVALIAVSLAISVAAIGTSLDSALYPWLYIGIAIGAIALVSVIPTATDTSTMALLAGLVGLSVFFRLYTFLYPASMIGMDPDRKAISTQRVIETGHTDTILRSFYQDVPLFSVYGAEFGLIGGVDGTLALIIYSIALGVLLPLTAAILARNATRQSDVGITVLAAVAGGIETIGVLEGFWTHNQTLGIALWCGLLVVLAIQSKRIWRLTVAVFLVLGAMVFAHKLPLFVVLFVCLATILCIWVYNRSSNSRDLSMTRSSQTVSRVGTIAGILLFTQWTYLADFTEHLVAKVVALFTVSPYIGNITNLEPTAAKETLPPHLDLLFWRGHGFAILALAGLAWVSYHIHVWRDSSDIKTNDASMLVISSAVVFAGGAAVGAVKSSIIPAPRLISLGGPVFGALIAFSLLPDRSSVLRRYIVSAAVVLLVLSQIFSLMIMIDHPDRPRMYLTAGEIEAKEFNHQYVPGEVHTDWYYSKETVPSRIIEVGRGEKTGTVPRKHKIIQLELLNAQLNGSDYTYVSYRTDATVQRTEYGKFELTWDPETRLDTQTSRIFDSGATVTYH